MRRRKQQPLLLPVGAEHAEHAEHAAEARQARPESKPVFCRHPGCPCSQLRIYPSFPQECGTCKHSRKEHSLFVLFNAELSLS
jgi:hypothetical protein